MSANLAHETLRQDAVQGRDEVIELDLHVQETSQNVHDVVRMDRRENQMAGQGGLHRDLSGLFVADLTNHDLVRVMTQDRAETPRERQAFFLVDRDLGDAAQLILDGIFDRHDLVLDRLDLRQARVQRRRFSRTRRAGHENHPVWLADELAQFLLGLEVESEHLQVQTLELRVGRFLVEDPDDRVFAVNRRHDGDAKIDRTTAHPELEPPVLRYPLFGDVELRHDFDAGDDRSMVPLVDGIHGLIQNAVDAVLDDDHVLLRLDVHVRGTPLNRVENDRIHQFDDGRRVLSDPVDRQGFFAFFVLGHELHPELLGRFVEDALGGLALLEDVRDRRAAADLEAERDAD